jgi:polysaccharide biosynthesis/export protein
MNYPLVPATALLALLLAACKSNGPDFDPRASAPQTNSPRELLALTNTADLEEQAFTNLTRASALKPEMLQVPTNLYRLGPGDNISIEVLGEVGSRGTPTVGPDGKIYYSLLPGTFVWGLTLTETKDVLEKGLKKYLRVPPDITITLNQVGSKTVWVLGNVNAPGIYPLATPVRLLEGITAAGGPLSAPGAADGVCDLQRSFLMRDGKLLPVDFDKLLRAGDMSQNIYLQPNDFIFLRSGITRNIYLMGAVAGPGVVPYRDDLTLAGAILASGGMLPYAQAGHVAIIRGSLAEPRIASVDYRAILKGKATDVRLEPGDIIYVSFVPWRKLAVLAEAVLDTFVQTVAANEGYKLTYPNASPTGPVVPVTQPNTVVVPSPTPTR